MASQPAVSQSQDQERIRHLKLKIKAWEKEFASQNNGKAPGKEDVNANPKMAARYAEFYKLKKGASSKDSQGTDSQSFSQFDSQSTKKAKTPRKQSAAGPFRTPLKTPSRTSANPFLSTPTNRPELLGRFDSPSASAIRRLKWMAKEYVSPTPQKNGKVLGLFDTLPGMTPTPVKRTREENDQDLLTRLTDSAKKSKVSHNFHDNSDDEDGYVPLDPTTPSRKRRYEFQTPLSKKSKRQDSDEMDPFATPAFFRQHHFNFDVKESGSPESPDIKRFLPNTRMIGKVKPLSALVKELKEIQSEDDPGMDVLREIEQEELNKKDAVTSAQTAENPDDPSIPSATVADGEKEAERDAKLPVYKKKGQKRQTKRVKIRPIRAKQTKAAAEEVSDPALESESESEDDEDDADNTSQVSTRGKRTTKAINKTSPPDDEDESDDGSEVEEDDSDVSEVELSAISSKKTKAAAKRQQVRPFKQPATTAAAAATKKKRTVNPNKHLNFRRMDIHKKNRGFKGKGGRRR